MSRETLYHWGATREIMEVIRGKSKSWERRVLVERRETLARSVTMRNNYDPLSQRTTFAPSRPDKRSQKEIAEIDVELTHRANRLGGDYQPIEIIKEEEEMEAPEEGGVQVDRNTVDTEEDCVIEVKTYRLLTLQILH